MLKERGDILVSKSSMSRFHASLGMRPTRRLHAPIQPIRDQGNSKLGTGDVEAAVVRGMLLAYDTDKRLQQEGLSKAFSLETWNVEAGPAYFDETVVGVQKAIEGAKAEAGKRPSNPYAKTK